jgi:hypothetical protein
MDSTPTTSISSRKRPDAVVDGIGAIPVLEARETSGMTSKLVLAYAEWRGGPAAVQEILRHCGFEDREEELWDEAHGSPSRRRSGCSRRLRRSSRIRA